MAAAMAADPNIERKPPDKAWTQVVLGRSFAEIVAGGSKMKDIEIKTPTTYKGEPAIYFNEEEIQILAEPFKFALVGKFSKGRPAMEIIRRFFAKLNLHTDYKIGLIDSKHILIHLQSEEDYHRVWMRQQWNIFQFPMTITKWHVNFTPENECPILPIWVSLPYLPPHLFNKGALISIAKVVGVPMKVDNSTANLLRPSMARVCVEADVSKPLPKRTWIGQGKTGFWQTLQYEDIPRYCSECHQVGHNNQTCIMTVNDKTEAAVRDNKGIADKTAQNKADEPANKYYNHQKQNKAIYRPKTKENLTAMHDQDGTSKQATQPRVEPVKEPVEHQQNDQPGGHLGVETDRVTAQTENEAVGEVDDTDSQIPETPASQTNTSNRNIKDRGAKSMDHLLIDLSRKESNDIHRKCVETGYSSENDIPKVTVGEKETVQVDEEESDGDSEDKEINVQIEGQDYKLVTNRKKKKYIQNPELQRTTRAKTKDTEGDTQTKTTRLSNE